MSLWVLGQFLTLTRSASGGLSQSVSRVINRAHLVLRSQELHFRSPRKLNSKHTYRMAHRQAFYDPFASIHLRLEESTPSYSISEWFPAPLPNHETPDGEAAIMMMSDQSPIALKPLPLPLIIANPSPDTDGDLESQRGRASIQLPIKGQGVIAVRVPPGDCEGLTISVWSSSSGVFPPTMLSLNLRKKSCSLEYSTPDNTTPIEWKKPKSEQASYLQEGTVEETYWLSVDRPNGWIRWGRGYTNVALATGEVELKYKDDTGVMVWKDKGKFEWLDTVQDVRYTLWGPNYDNVRDFSCSLGKTCQRLMTSLDPIHMISPMPKSSFFHFLWSPIFPPTSSTTPTLLYPTSRTTTSRYLRISLPSVNVFTITSLEPISFSMTSLSLTLVKPFKRVSTPRASSDSICWRRKLPSLGSQISKGRT